MHKKLLVLLISFAILWSANLGQAAFALNTAPVLSFTNKNAIKYEKTLRVGEVELLEFNDPVSLAHYGTSNKSLDYIELEKLEASTTGYKKFMIKAKEVGSGELTFKSGAELIKIKIIVEENYSSLEKELNTLFGIANATEAEQIKVISANLVSDIKSDYKAHIYLKGKVASPKNAMLAVAFAANAVGDHGVKIFSNPGGQLRLKDLDSDSNQVNSSPQQSTNNNNSSFVEFYESTNKLIDTNNLYRDLILASEEEKVISYLQIQEPQRFAVKVRFLEMDARFVDDFIASLSASSTANDIKGSLGSTDLVAPTLGRSLSTGGSRITDAIGAAGIERFASNIVSGSLVSGTIKILDNAFLNLNMNDLLQEGVLRIVNEFALITHSGESVSLGKGTRFPIPKLNNGVGNSSISVEYIPIGFKGELKVTGLENKLIDVQLASRLSSAQSSTSSIQGLVIPIFSEEYVNSGALLGDGQEVILNAFMTESETLAKASSPLGKLIPFLGSSKTKQKTKNLLFIVLQAEEIEASSLNQKADKFNLPHLDFSHNKNIYGTYSTKLRAKNISDQVDLGLINEAKRKSSAANTDSISPLENIDPLSLEGAEI